MRMRLPGKGVGDTRRWIRRVLASHRTGPISLPFPGAPMTAFRRFRLQLAVADTAAAAARRCVQAQTRLHAAATLGDGQLERWAREHAEGSGLQWREYAAGGASSVLAVHALIAAAADPATTRSDAERIDRAYLAIGAVITILDSLVDRAADAAAGQGVHPPVRAGRADGPAAGADPPGAAAGIRGPARRSSRDDARGCRRLLHDAPRRTRPGRTGGRARCPPGAFADDLADARRHAAWRAAKYARALRGRRGAARVRAVNRRAVGRARQ